MTLPEAQDIAFKLLNLNSKKVTLQEIYSALAILANFYEDYKCYIDIEDDNSRKAEKCL